MPLGGWDCCTQTALNDGSLRFYTLMSLELALFELRNGSALELSVATFGTLLSFQLAARYRQ